jgi:deoxyribodipyrimidine photo-lyase
MSSGPAIVWLRDDLRLDDQPALAAAAERPTLVVYIFDEESPGLRPLGGAAKWWLAHSLAAFGAELAAIGGRLDILRGASEPTLLRLAEASGAGEVFWTRRYGAAEIAIDAAAKASLIAKGVAARSFNGQLLYEPWRTAGKDGAPSRV